jgi:hypothetical protein
MSQALQTTSEAPRDAATGLTLPLKTFLGSQALAQHRAMVSIELEVLAKKFDRFGWDRDRGSMAQDRLISDWMDALQDFPLDEVRAACKAAVLADPKNMPNEGHIVAKVMAARAQFVASHKRIAPPKVDARPMDVGDAERARRVALAAELLGGSAKPFPATGEAAQ